MGQRNKNNVVRFRAKGAVPPTPKVHCPGADVERPIPVGQGAEAAEEEEAVEAEEVSGWSGGGGGGVI